MILKNISKTTRKIGSINLFELFRFNSNGMLQINDLALFYLTE